MIGQPLGTSVRPDVAAIQSIDAVTTILQVVCQVTGLGFSAVARVTDKQWIACAVRDEIAFGLQPGGELELKTTICDEIRDSGKLVVIDHAATDEAFCNHPTPQKYGFQSYISAPIHLPDGRFFGTLCAIDPKPATVNTPAIIGMFTLFADLIAQHLDAQERMAANESALHSERETAKLREQFIAVVGHDLRNPLAAIAGGAELLRRMPQSETGADLVMMIKRGATRMAGLIDNILDFARGRLGGGLVLNRKVDDGLRLALQQVVDELQTANPGREFHRALSLNGPVYCDSARLAQLLSNLIANAITHGDPDSPIAVAVHGDGDELELSVTNRGQTIPPHVAEHLFQPFARGKSRSREEGLGLGLYIASEIALAHAGTLSVTSADGETCFKLRIPKSER